MTDNNVILSNNSAVLVEDSLMAFGAGMSLQSRNDVKNSFHFASLVASKLYDQEEQGEAWYNQFLKVMQDCGWVIGRRSYERESASTTTVTVGAVALRVLGAAGKIALGGPVGDVLGKLAGAALDRLGVIQEDKQLFVQNKDGKGQGMVGLGACLETADGEVVMVMCCVDATAPASETDLLGIEWTLSATEHYTGTSVLSFNKLIYARVRDHVADKLGERSISNVMEYDI